jgi:hypothetical protein
VFKKRTKALGKDENGKKKKSQLFRPKVFDMYFPQKVFYDVFELPLLRNAQKRHKKITKIKKKKVPTYPIYHLPGIRRFQFYFSSAPLEKNNRERKKTEETKATFFFMSPEPRWICFNFLCYFLLDFFNRVFLAFRNKGSLKTRKQQRKQIFRAIEQCLFCFTFFFSLDSFARFFFACV